MPPAPDIPDRLEWQRLFHSGNIIFSGDELGIFFNW